MEIDRTRHLDRTTAEPYEDTPRASGDARARAADLPHATAAERHAAEAARLFASASATASSDGIRHDDGVLYVGMNTSNGQCDREARALAKMGHGVRSVVAHGELDPALGADRVMAPGGGVFDLATPAGAASFAASLGLPAKQTDAVRAAIFGANAGSRDELAGIARVWAEAERGGTSPSRLVLSGHCAGVGVYDSGSSDVGFLAFDAIRALAAAMPRAAAQVEDLMLSACSSGRVEIADWQASFPNLKTAWGYGGKTDYHSPTGAEAVRHIATWEKETRGRVASLTPHERNVSTWSARDGWVQGK